jgi:serine phosphatase RsbU (regulator of sigma subunit)
MDDLISTNYNKLLFGSIQLKFTQLPLLTLLHNEFKSDLVNVESGDLFIMYSDGIIETTNKKKEEFGFER